MALASTGFAASTKGLFVPALAGGVTLSVCIAGLFLADACLGLIIPTTMVMELYDHGDIRGLTSSLRGTLQILVGSVMIAAAGSFFDGTAMPMLRAIAVCGITAFGLSQVMALRQAAAA